MVPVKPIDGFGRRWDILLEKLSAWDFNRNKLRVAVVGGGAGGVELVLSMQYRILKELQRRGYILGLQTGEDTEFKVASIVTAPHSFFNLSSESKVTTNSSQLFGELRNFVEFTLLTRSPKLLPTHSEGV